MTARTEGSCANRGPGGLLRGSDVRVELTVTARSKPRVSTTRGRFRPLTFLPPS
jgi:hypothetical protein